MAKKSGFSFKIETQSLTFLIKTPTLVVFYPVVALKSSIKSTLSKSSLYSTKKTEAFTFNVIVLTELSSQELRD